MNDLRAKRAALNLATAAIMEHLSHITVAVIGQHDGRPNGLGSGTGVRIAGRFFVLTAKHVVEGYSDAAIGLVARQDRPAEFMPILSKGAHPTADVAWLEISPDAVQAIRKSFVQLDRVRCGVRHIQDDLVLLSGYPSVLVERSNLDQKELGVRPLAYHSVTVAPEEWPTPVDRPLDAAEVDPDTDIFIEYPENNNYGADDQLVASPELKGMSGGGVWSTNMNKAGIFTPESAQLVGIFLALWTKRRVGRALRVDVALRLIASDVPDLADVIEEHLRNSV